MKFFSETLPSSIQKKPKEIFEEAPEHTDIEREFSRSIEIATKTGNYEEIIDRLKSEGLWENQLYNIQKQFDSQIDMTDFPTQEDFIWEMLTVLFLYDSETVKHSIETYKLLKKRIGDIEIKNLFLAEILKKENFELEQLYFASLTHDVGKICIPPFIISNSLTKKNWDDFLLKMAKDNELDQNTKEELEITDGNNHTDEEILAKIQNSSLRSKDIVPVEKGLPEDQKEELENKWKISGKLPLMKIIDRHALFSAKILEEKGFEKTAKLVAGHHHKQNNTIDLLPFKNSQPNKKLASALHLADVEQALKSKRHYKESFSELKTILELTKETKMESIDKAVAYFWIKERRNNFVRKNDISELDDAEKISLAELDEHLELLKTGESQEEINQWLQKGLLN